MDVDAYDDGETGNGTRWRIGIRGFDNPCALAAASSAVYENVSVSLVMGVGSDDGASPELAACGGARVECKTDVFRSLFLGDAQALSPRGEKRSPPVSTEDKEQQLEQEGEEEVVAVPEANAGTTSPLSQDALLLNVLHATWERRKSGHKASSAATRRHMTDIHNNGRHARMLLELFSIKHLVTVEALLKQEEKEVDALRGILAREPVTSDANHLRVAVAGCLDSGLAARITQQLIAVFDFVTHPLDSVEFKDVVETRAANAAKRLHARSKQEEMDFSDSEDGKEEEEEARATPEQRSAAVWMKRAESVVVQSLVSPHRHKCATCETKTVFSVFCLACAGRTLSARSSYFISLNAARKRERLRKERAEAQRVAKIARVRALCELERRNAEKKQMAREDEHQRMRQEDHRARKVAVLAARTKELLQLGALATEILTSVVETAMVCIEEQQQLQHAASAHMDASAVEAANVTAASQSAAGELAKTKSPSKKEKPAVMKALWHCENPGCDASLVQHSSRIESHRAQCRFVVLDLSQTWACSNAGCDAKFPPNAKPVILSHRKSCPFSVAFVPSWYCPREGCSMSIRTTFKKRIRDHQAQCLSLSSLAFAFAGEEVDTRGVVPARVLQTRPIQKPHATILSPTQQLPTAPPASPPRMSMHADDVLFKKAYVLVRRRNKRRLAKVKTMVSKQAVLTQSEEECVAPSIKYGDSTEEEVSEEEEKEGLTAVSVVETALSAGKVVRTELFTRLPDARLESLALQCVLDTLAFLQRSMIPTRDGKQTKKADEFATYGGDMLFLFRNVALYAAHPKVRAAVLAFVDAGICAWDADGSRRLEVGDQRESLLVKVELLHAKMQLLHLTARGELHDVRCVASCGQASPLLEVERYAVVEALLFHSTSDLLRWDFASNRSSVPVTGKVYCGRCGQFVCHELHQAVPECPQCGGRLRREIDYDAVLEAVVWMSVFRDIGIVRVETADGVTTFEEVLKVSLQCRPYRSVQALGRDSWVLQAYLVTHIVFVLSGWGQFSLDRMLLLEEFIFLRENLKVAICLRDAELVGEMIHALHILGVDLQGTASTREGMCFLLAFNSRISTPGSWWKKNNYFKSYHVAYTAVLGLSSFLLPHAAPLEQSIIDVLHNQ